MITRVNNTQISFILIRFNINLNFNYLWIINHNLVYLLNTYFYILKFNSIIKEQWVFIVINDALYIDDVFIRYNIKRYLFQLFKDIIN
jgi:hypothetical protein